MFKIEFFDVDHANDFTENLSAPTTLRPVDSGKFHVQGQILKAGSLMVFEAASTTGYKAQYTHPLDDFVFGIERRTTDLRAPFWVETPNVQETFVLDRKATDGMSVHAMAAQKGVIIEAATVMKEVSSRLGQEQVARIIFAPAGMSNHVHMVCQNICRTLQMGISEHGGLAGNQLAIANLEDALLNTILHGASHSYSAALQRGSIELPRVVRRAMEFINANAHLPITPTDVAVASGLSIRSLQLTFRERLETTPQHYLRRIRLGRAHADLKAGEGPGVREIAQKWGFYSSGEFARLFFAEFGEKPGEVFRRGNWR
ncbi:AraC family transcriptional regulator (plasmid) [Agrobacterium tumefaciens]|nr:AraC family transcriptional regulator [Agrobacterium tumefaciens]